MFTLSINNARISKGFGDRPAVYMNEKGTFMSFRVSWKKDKENWENVSVRVLNPGLLDRVKKLDLKEGSTITVAGDLDFETYTDKNGVTQKSPVLIAKDISFARGIPSTGIAAVFGTGGRISTGYGDNPAIYKNEAGTLASFRVGFPVFDKSAENNTRWENIECRMIGDFAKVAETLKLDAKAIIDFSGIFTYDVYEKDGHNIRKPIVMIDRIARVNDAKKKDEAAPAATDTSAPAEAVPAPTGYAGTEDYPDDLPF